MSLDGVNLTQNFWLLIHSEANKAPLTVSVFKLLLIFLKQIDLAKHSFTFSITVGKTDHTEQHGKSI